MSNPITAADLAEALREIIRSPWCKADTSKAKAILARFDAQQTEARKPVEHPHEWGDPTARGITGRKIRHCKWCGVSYSVKRNGKLCRDRERRNPQAIEVTQKRIGGTK